MKDMKKINYKNYMLFMYYMVNYNDSIRE